MKKKLLLIVILIFSIFSISCTAKEENPQKGNDDIEIAKTDNVKTDKSFSNSVTYFGKNILTKEYKKNNTVVSPLSLHLAFDMVYNGAGGETEVEMRKTLGYPSNMDKKSISEQSKAIMDNLKSNDSMTLEIANSLWTKKGFKIKKSFIDNSKNYFYAEVKNTTSSSVINKWVSDKTHKKINKIANNEVDTALINAIYFNGNWVDKFDKDATRDRNFTTLDKQKMKVPTMYKCDDMPYYENKKYQAVRLNYKGNKISMFVFLPNEKKSIDDFVKDFSQDEFLNASKNLSRTNLELYLPKFKAECSFELSKTVKELGMKSAFDGRANFNGIAEKLCISEIIHKTYIDVNESGTEAAAVTAVMMNCTAVPFEEEVKPKCMRVDRPFFFVLSDNDSNIPVFMGVITKPEYK